MSVDTLRPRTLAEFVGQDLLKERLQVHIDAARARDATMEDVLLAGRPGMGKTSLGELIAEELGVDFECLMMPVSSSVLARLFRTFTGVLMLDELHRGSKAQQEELLPLLEFHYLRGPGGRRIEVSGVTFVGATTNIADVIKPLRERFPIQPPIDDYSNEEIGQIVMGMARKIGLEMSRDMAVALGRAAAGTPRKARQFVLAARDLLLADNEMPSAENVLEFCRVTPDGLEVGHIDYLRALDRQGGVAGLRTLATILRDNEKVVEDLEELLVDQDLITYSERGRELTKAGARRLKELASAAA